MVIPSFISWIDSDTIKTYQKQYFLHYLCIKILYYNKSTWKKKVRFY